MLEGLESFRLNDYGLASAGTERSPVGAVVTANAGAGATSFTILPISLDSPSTQELPPAFYFYKLVYFPQVYGPIVVGIRTPVQLFKLAVHTWNHEPSDVKQACQTAYVDTVFNDTINNVGEHEQIVSRIASLRKETAKLNGLRLTDHTARVLAFWLNGLRGHALKLAIDTCKPTRRKRKRSADSPPPPTAPVAKRCFALRSPDPESSSAAREPATSATPQQGVVTPNPVVGIDPLLFAPISYVAPSFDGVQGLAPEFSLSPLSVGMDGFYGMPYTFTGQASTWPYSDLDSNISTAGFEPFAAVDHYPGLQDTAHDNLLLKTGVQLYPEFEPVVAASEQQADQSWW